MSSTLLRFCFIFLMTINFILLSTAQSLSSIDSLFTKLKNEKVDTFILRKYTTYLDSLTTDKKEEIEIISNWVIDNAILLQADKIEITASVVLASTYLAADKLKEATDLYNKVILMGVKEEKSNYQYLSRAYIGMYNYYKQTGEYKIAAEYIDKNLLLSKKYDYKAGIAKSKYGLSGLLEDNGYPNNKDTFYLRLNLMNEASALWATLKDTAQMYRVKIGIAETLAEYNLYDSAIFTLESNKINLVDKFNQKFAAPYYFTLGKVYNQKAGYLNEKKELHGKAIDNFLLCISFAKKSNNNKYLLWGYNWLSSSYKYIDDYKNAYKYKNIFSNLNDSILDASYLQSMASAQHKYKVEKKDKEILLLNTTNQKKSTLNKILIGSATSLLFIGLLGYRNFKTKQKLQQTQITQLEKDKQLLAVDAMLKGQEEERSRLAKDLHDGLGGMLSGVKLSFVNMKENMVMDAPSVHSFEASILQLDNTIAELRKVAHNLMPEALVKFGLKNAVLDFCNSMQLSSKTKIIFEQMGNDRPLSNTADLYIYRIIQELINNAMKHAEPNQILVQLTKAEKNILITVENDGKDFDTSAIKNATGIGMQSVQQRVNYFTGKIDITSDKKNGTSINIELNV